LIGSLVAMLSKTFWSSGPSLDSYCFKRYIMLFNKVITTHILFNLQLQRQDFGGKILSIDNLNVMVWFRYLSKW
jgi:hypothetical protein